MVLCLKVEPKHDCPEWCAYYDVRGGLMCACALAKGHESQHQCCCGFEWGKGAAPTSKPEGAEMLMASPADPSVRC